jgi:hypothetical protein
MKRMLLLLLVFAIACLYAQGDEMKTLETRKALDTHFKTAAPQLNRDAPTYSFAVLPTAFMDTYYDYMPGSYNSTPLHLLPDGSLYAAFHGTQTSASTRRVYYAFINGSDGSISTNYISSNSVAEGYCGIDLDPETSDPLFAWHAVMDADEYREDVFAYDAYHTLPGPGMLSEPFVLMDNGSWTGAYQPPFPTDDDFDWPYVYITKAPSYDQDGARRVYVIANNGTGHGTDGNPSENVLIAYTDYTTADLDAQNFASMDWHYETIPQMDEWNAGPDWIRPFHTTATMDDGRLAILGYIVGDSTVVDSYADPDLFVFYNDNYGEGDWGNYPLVNGQLYVDVPDSVATSFGGQDFFFGFTDSGHSTAAWDGLGRVHTPSIYALCGTNTDNGSSVYWSYYLNVKDLIWDSNTNTYTTVDIYPRGANPSDGVAMLPWDQDEDGLIDRDDDGNIVMASDWPIYWWETDDAFHENLIKISKNEEIGCMAMVWEDGLGSRYFNDSQLDEYAAYATVPEIFIAVSTDNGSTWSEPIVLNSIDTPELQGMIPEYVYIADKIEYAGEGAIKLHLMFYDDNSYGSFARGGDGTNAGGSLTYACIEVSGLDIAATGEHTAKPTAAIKLQNSPNPFNPETRISFSIPKNENVALSVYNVRGQIVKNLVSDKMEAGDHSITWNGRDNNGAACSSGVYFSRLQVGGQTTVRKMNLLK